MVCLKRIKSRGVCSTSFLSMYVRRRYISSHKYDFVSILTVWLGSFYAICKHDFVLGLLDYM